jgi:VanZ family protein
LLAVALVVITYLATAPADYPPLLDQISDKLEHLLAFYGLALLTDFAFRGTDFGLAKALPLLGYGLLIEFLQSFVPYRDVSLWDLTADALGLIAYGASVPLLRRTPLLTARWSA